MDTFIAGEFNYNIPWRKCPSFSATPAFSFKFNSSHGAPAPVWIIDMV